MRVLESSELMVENTALGSCYGDSDPMSPQGPERLHFKEALVGMLMQGVPKYKLMKLPRENGPDTVGTGYSENKPGHEVCLCPF